MMVHTCIIIDNALIMMLPVVCFARLREYPSDATDRHPRASVCADTLMLSSRSPDGGTSPRPKGARCSDHPPTSAGFTFIHDAAPSITPEELARVRAVIQIDEVLSDWLSEPREAARWLRTIEMAPPFFGRTPLALLFRGMEGFEAITGYLEARRPAERTPRLP